jgi:hypothetical protein
VSCAALLALIAPGMSWADLDRGRVYEIPAAVVAAQPVSRIFLAKACAIHHGIKWIVK